MSKRETILRYSLIIKKLRKGPAGFSEISDYLSVESSLQEYNLSISKRTFQRDLEDIRSIYNIDIQYDHLKKAYYINFEEQPEVSELLFEAFDISSALNIGDNLSEYIHFQRKRSAGTEYLYDLLHAIKNQVQIRFNYLKYGEELATAREIEPYALKEFKNRWYLLANDLKDNRIKSFALDRISSLEIGSTAFLFPENFNINEYFEHSFGIISPNAEQPEEVVLSFTPFQGKYIKSLPLHKSQEILIDNSSELRVKLKMFVTYDFLMELLSYGENVKVIQPESLKDEMITVFKKALKLYE